MSGKGKGIPEKPIPEHGTRARYVHRLFPCHCDLCGEANASYLREYRRRTGRNRRQGRPKRP